MPNFPETEGNAVTDCGEDDVKLQDYAPSHDHQVGFRHSGQNVDGVALNTLGILSGHQIVHEWGKSGAEEGQEGHRHYVGLPQCFVTLDVQGDVLHLILH